MEKKTRLKRKVEHLNKFIELSDGPNSAGFGDIHLIHQALPSFDYNQVNPKQKLWGKTLSFPLIINAVTGGPPQAEDINRILSEVAAEQQIGIAVGSQKIALDEPSTRKSFITARKHNPKGLVIANISAASSYNEALVAVEMLEADALQLHLNSAQEVMMPEGETNFSELEENIAKIVNKLSIPVIIKEVGFGISRETLIKLEQIGVKWIDISGSGGTNFIKIESARTENLHKTSLVNWGIPTVANLLEVKDVRFTSNIIASGGIRNGLDLAKTCVLGAECGAVAAPFIRMVLKSQPDSLSMLIQNWYSDFKKTMFLTGAKNISQLKEVSYVVTGFTKQWIEQRKM